MMVKVSVKYVLVRLSEGPLLTHRGQVTQVKSSKSALVTTMSCRHHIDVIMRAMASQITGASIVCSTVASGADQRKHQSSASLASVRGIHRWAVNSPKKRLVTRKMFPLDDVIMAWSALNHCLGQYGLIVNWTPWEQSPVKFGSDYKFHSRKWIWIIFCNFMSASMC